MSVILSQQIRARARYYVFMIRLAHSDGSVTRVNTGFRNLVWDDGYGDGEQTWKGTGRVVSLSLPDEGEAASVTEWSMSLSGVSSDYRSLAAEDVRGQSVRVHIAVIGEDGDVMVAQLQEDGVQDRVEWREDESMENHLTLYCLSGLTFLSNQVIGRWSAETHAAYLTGLGIDPDTDTGLDAQHGIPDDARQAAWWPLN